MIVLIVAVGVLSIALVGAACLYAQRRVDAHVKAPHRDQVAHVEGGRPR